MHYLKVITAGLSILILWSPSNSHALEKKPLWELGPGLAYLSIPEYRGAGQQQEYLLPIPYFVYRGTFLKVDRQGATGVLYETPRLELTLSFSASPPVKSDPEGVREGMPDLDPAFEIGPMLSWYIIKDEELKVSLRFPARMVRVLDLDDPEHVGILSTPSLTTDLSDYPFRKWQTGLSLGLLWSDSDYNSYYYEVGSQYSTPSRPVYHARRGFGGTWGRVTLSRRFQKTWLGIIVLYENVSQAVYSDSPLVEQNNSLMLGIGYSWILFRSKAEVLIPSQVSGFFK